MRTLYFLILLIFLTGSLQILSSCKKSHDNPNNDEVSNDPVGPDHDLPYQYSDWMANISDTMYLSEITIPGTHDAGADLHTSQQGSMSKYTIAQDFRLANQLMMGVRWFDIRLSDDEGTMTIYHGPYYLHKNFNDLLNPALDFLEAHPTETVIFMIKQEHSNRGDAAFAHGVYWNYLNKNLNRYWLDDHMPTLGQVRGKLIIMRRFNDTGGLPLGAPLVWDENTKGAYYSSNHFNFYVQDHYKCATVSYDTKIEEIKDCSRKAHNEPHPTQYLYINFTSCEKDLDHYLTTIASNINPVINSWLLTPPVYNNCGVVMVNFAGGSDDGVVEKDLVKTLVNLNVFDTSGIKIGSQRWMRKNLDVTAYRNGDPIPNVTGNDDWRNLSTGAYCDVNNNPANSPTNGRLYNRWAMGDSRGLCPTGWHIPSDDEWTTLMNYLGGGDVAGGKMKESGYAHWYQPNTGATNSSGFTAIPAGYRDGFDGSFCTVGIYGLWWSTGPTHDLWFNFNEDSSLGNTDSNAGEGHSVRCIHD